MAQLFEAQPANDLPPVPNYNVCPTNRVHAVVSDGQRRLVAMRWGFLPHWYKTPSDGPLLINARAESVAEKPAFRAAARERRCLIPADGFYEWTKDAGGRPPAVVLPPRRWRPGRLRGSLAGLGARGRAADHLRHRHHRGAGQHHAGPPPRAGDPAPRGLGALAGRGGEGRGAAHDGTRRGRVDLPSSRPEGELQPRKRSLPGCASDRLSSVDKKRPHRSAACPVREETCPPLLGREFRDVPAVVRKGCRHSGLGRSAQVLTVSLNQNGSRDSRCREGM
jgi:hypothetical protein